MARDIILDTNNDLIIENGDFIVGISLMQDVGIILQSNQGDFKEHPIIGANLIQQIRGVEDTDNRERNLRIQMRLDNKNYDDIKSRLKQNYNANN